MRRVLLLFVGSGLLLLLCSAVPLLAQHTRNNLLPPGATDMRIRYRSLSQKHTTYHIPPGWTLLNLYNYLADHGWTRDNGAEARLRSSEADGSTFAIFVRQQNWFGAVAEVAVVGIAPYRHARVQVRQVHCLTIEPAAGC